MCLATGPTAWTRLLPLYGHCSGCHGTQGHVAWGNFGATSTHPWQRTFCTLQSPICYQKPKASQWYLQYIHEPLAMEPPLTVYTSSPMKSRLCMMARHPSSNVSKTINYQTKRPPLYIGHHPMHDECYSILQYYSYTLHNYNLCLRGN